MSKESPHKNSTTEWVTAEELANMVRVHPQTIRHMAEHGLIPCLRVGVKKSALRFDPNAVYEALREKQETDADDLPLSLLTVEEQKNV